MIRTCASLFVAAAVLSHTPSRPQNPIIGNPQHPQPIAGWWDPLCYSQGYAMGAVAKIEDSGLAFQRLEGDLKLGINSSRAQVSPESCQSCTAPVNPWPFSNYNPKLLAVIHKLNSEIEVIRYDSYLWLPFLNSDNYLVRVYPTDGNLLKVGDQLQIKSPIFKSISYKDGYVEGRIIKASLKGVIRKAYNVTIQTGHGGNAFLKMNVNSSKMFRFIIKAMLSSRYLQIHFIKLIPTLAFPIDFIEGYDTDYRVIGIKVLQEPELEIGTSTYQP